MKTYIKVAIGCGSAVIAGIGGYFLYEKLKKDETDETMAQEEKEAEPEEEASSKVKLTWPDKNEKPSLEKLVNEIITKEHYTDNLKEESDIPEKPSLEELGVYKTIDPHDYIYSPEYSAYKKVTCSWYTDAKRMVNDTDCDVIIDVEKEVGPDIWAQLDICKPNDEFYCVNDEKKTCYEIIAVSGYFEESEDEKE